MSKSYPRQDVFDYVEAWKPVIESARRVFSQLQSGSMSGIVLIVATIGFNFDNVSKLHALQKWMIGGALVCLILALGNILNCVWAVDFVEGLMTGVKTRLIMDGKSDLTEEEFITLHQEVFTRLGATQQYHRYSYGCFFVAVGLGILCFLTILIR